MSDTARIRLLAGMIFAALAAIAVIAFTTPGRAGARAAVDHGDPWDSNGGIVEHRDGVSWTDFVWPAKSARDGEGGDSDRWDASQGAEGRSNAAGFRNTALFGIGADGERNNGDPWGTAGSDNTHWGSAGTDGSGEISAVPADGVSWT
ncbi:hypothetical protein [Phytomonospora endophytica]|uniref:Uncharacterized protein n=1 Tax=Phytomonospora endophytica TaxID=714109 RepID=A0A841G5A6_9ACTN|nr:hypothetical protein [Phytomonospora endophytica]MBB6039280.1 hypothetical protein [Phytomonospora endophytica]GIG69777.1 hypothetical protein Pen01_60720 [Phytomonospora endophytica]